MVMSVPSALEITVATRRTKADLQEIQKLIVETHLHACNACWQLIQRFVDNLPSQPVCPERFVSIHCSTPVVCNPTMSLWSLTLWLCMDLWVLLFVSCAAWFCEHVPETGPRGEQGVILMYLRCSLTAPLAFTSLQFVRTLCSTYLSITAGHRDGELPCNLMTWFLYWRWILPLKLFWIISNESEQMRFIWVMSVKLWSLYCFVKRMKGIINLTLGVTISMSSLCTTCTLIID